MNQGLKGAVTYIAIGARCAGIVPKTTLLPAGCGLEMEAVISNSALHQNTGLGNSVVRL